MMALSLFHKVKKYLIARDTDLSEAPDKVLVFPEGIISFEWEDGTKVRAVMDAQAAASVIANMRKTGRDLQWDWEHQSEGGQYSRPAGDGIAPAAGWIKDLEYVEGKGLVAKVEWTAKGREALTSKEYRYFSPVFWTDEKTNRITKLSSVALTNSPAMLALPPIVSSTKLTLSRPKAANTGSGAGPMEKVLQLLGIDPATLQGKSEEEQWSMIAQAIESKLGTADQNAQTASAVASALGLSSTDGKDKIIAAAKAAVDSSKTATKADEALKAVATELGCEPDGAKLVAAVKGIKTMKPGDPDPTKFVAKEQYDAVVKAQETDRAEITKIKASMLDRDTAEFIRGGEEAGKIIASTKPMWERLYKSDPAQAAEDLKTAPLVGPVVKKIANSSTHPDNPGAGGEGDPKDRKSIIASAKKEHGEGKHLAGLSAVEIAEESLYEAGLPKLTADEKKSLA